MSAVDIRKTIGVATEYSAITWLRNPTGSLRPVSIEPWGSTIYLLPGHEYAVITESERDDPPPGTSIDLGDQIIIWPEGTRSNRIYRADEHLVWDDAEPSDVFQLIDALSSPAVEIVRLHRGLHVDALARKLSDLSRSFDTDRNDLALLLIEHGVLSVDEKGNLAAG